MYIHAFVKSKTFDTILTLQIMKQQTFEKRGILINILKGLTKTFLAHCVLQYCLNTHSALQQWNHKAKALHKHCSHVSNKTSLAA